MSHSTETFLGEPFSVSLISDIEKFYAQEGYITFSNENFSSHSAGKFRRGTLLCFKESGVSKNFMHEGGFKVFCRKFLASQYRKTSWGTLLCFKSSGMEKQLWMRGVGVSRFPSEYLCLTVPKIFVRESFSQNISGTKKHLRIIGVGVITFFPSELLCLTVPKNFVQESFVLELFWCR